MNRFRSRGTREPGIEPMTKARRRGRIGQRIVLPHDVQMYATEAMLVKYQPLTDGVGYEYG